MVYDVNKLLAIPSTGPKRHTLTRLIDYMDVIDDILCGLLLSGANKITTIESTNGNKLFVLVDGVIKYEVKLNIKVDR